MVKSIILAIVGNSIFLRYAGGGSDIIIQFGFVTLDILHGSVAQSIRVNDNSILSYPSTALWRHHQDGDYALKCRKPSALPSPSILLMR